MWGYVIGATVIAALVWTARRAASGHVDRRFSVEGGKGGWIRYKDGEREAQFPFDLEEGGFDVGLAGAGWVSPEQRPFSTTEEAEVLSALFSWAGTQGIPIRLDRRPWPTS
jgi:hypothetical protein